jgi:hypothetical protein
MHFTHKMEKKADIHEKGTKKGPRQGNQKSPRQGNQKSPRQGNQKRSKKEAKH